MIFTREDEDALARFIIEKLGRGVTFWNGVGAYTGENVHVLCVCLSKYEIEELLHTVHTMDPTPSLPPRRGPESMETSPGAVVTGAERRSVTLRRFFGKYPGRAELLSHPFRLF